MTPKAPAHTAKRIVEIGRLLHARNLLAASDGNISAYLPEADLIAITPSQRPKVFLRSDEMALICASTGEVIKGKPSSERLLHQAIYQQCPKARWVLHAHPPTAVAWALAHPDAKELPLEYLAEIILGAGAIPIAPFALPGGSELPESVTAFLPQHRLIILARHGAVAWGESPEEAYAGMERLEHSAQILRDAFLMGRPQPLPTLQLEKLRALRKQIGDHLL